MAAEDSPKKQINTPPKMSNHCFNVWRYNTKKCVAYKLNMCRNERIYIHVCKSRHANVCVCVHIHTYISTTVHACTHTHTYCTDAHTHIHTRSHKHTPWRIGHCSTSRSTSSKDSTYRNFTIKIQTSDAFKRRIWQNIWNGVFRPARSKFFNLTMSTQKWK